MSDRLTPEQLAVNAWTRSYLYELTHEHGYVIVHPDDIDPNDPWDAHAAIFGNVRMTRTHTFKYQIGDVLRVGSPGVALTLIALEGPDGP